jgi:hypothetical protein
MGTPAIFGASICKRCIFSSLEGALSAPIGPPGTEYFAQHFQMLAPSMAGVPLLGPIHSQLAGILLIGTDYHLT